MLARNVEETKTRVLKYVKNVENLVDGNAKSISHMACIQTLFDVVLKLLNILRSVVNHLDIVNEMLDIQFILTLKKNEQNNFGQNL